MKTIKGLTCTVCGHDHWCYHEEDIDLKGALNTGQLLCCPCDTVGGHPRQESQTREAMHDPVYGPESTAKFN